jgi:hypothetical protein
MGFALALFLCASAFFYPCFCFYAQALFFTLAPYFFCIQKKLRLCFYSFFYPCFCFYAQALFFFLFLLLFLIKNKNKKE